MGYTHYWTIGRNDYAWAHVYREVAGCAKEIIEEARERGIEITGPGGAGEPILDASGIYLNGNPLHESFILKSELNQGSICKTERKPYDAVVTAILLCAAVIGEGSIRVTSDGDWDDWAEGRAIVEKLFPKFELSPSLVRTWC